MGKFKISFRIGLILGFNNHIDYNNNNIITYYYLTYKQQYVKMLRAYSYLIYKLCSIYINLYILDRLIIKSLLNNLKTRIQESL